MKMNDVERHYQHKYQLPNCEGCNQDMLCYNNFKVHNVQLFCANDKCPRYVKTFWVAKSGLKEE